MVSLVSSFTACGELTDDSTAASVNTVTSGGSVQLSTQNATEQDGNGGMDATLVPTSGSFAMDAYAVADVQSYLIQINDRLHDAESLEPSQNNARQWGLDSGLAVSAEAGPIGGEISWLVAHIADGAEQAGPAGPLHVRALIARREAGISAMLHLFSGGDALRVPWARVVVQENLVSACRSHGGGDEARRMVRWLETGSTTGAIDPRARWRWPWMRGPEFAWTPLAMQRLRMWVAAGLSCDLRQIQSSSDAGTH